MDPVHEEDLPRLLASDLHEYFDRFDAFYRQQLLDFIQPKLVHSFANAEDVVQETFERAYKALASYLSEEVEKIRFKPWLCKIAYHCLLNMLRRQKISPISYDDPQGEGLIREMEDYQFKQPEEAVEYDERCDERCQKLYKLLETLPPKYCKPLVLRHLEGFSYVQIAEKLQISKQHARQYVAYAMDQLRNRACQGYDSPDLR